MSPGYILFDSIQVRTLFLVKSLLCPGDAGLFNLKVIKSMFFVRNYLFDKKEANFGNQFSQSF